MFLVSAQQKKSVSCPWISTIFMFKNFLYEVIKVYYVMPTVI